MTSSENTEFGKGIIDNRIPIKEFVLCEMVANPEIRMIASGGSGKTLDPTSKVYQNIERIKRIKRIELI
jgi:tRNA A37 threonylcarbamoyladenosine dehydratase